MGGSTKSGASAASGGLGEAAEASPPMALPLTETAGPLNLMPDAEITIEEPPTFSDKLEPAVSFRLEPAFKLPWAEVLRFKLPAASRSVLPWDFNEHWPVVLIAICPLLVKPSKP